MLHTRGVDVINLNHFHHLAADHATCSASHSNLQSDDYIFRQVPLELEALMDPPPRSPTSPTLSFTRWVVLCGVLLTDLVFPG